MLTISKEEPSAIDDAKITLQVKSKLAMEKGISASKINVKTMNGVVFLTGKLDSQKQASIAVEIASSVSGAIDVDTSKLEVSESNQPLVDIYITAKVKGLFLREELFGSKEVAAIAINVETKNGIVYLSGTVNKADLEKNAISLARQIKGVKEVVSNIKVN